jgi:predicted methyltransferase
MIRSNTTLSGLLLSLVLCTGAYAAHSLPTYITAAVNDAGRPDADKARDADRKPGEVIAFAGIKPGEKVADFLPGGGYFTRLFAKVVGPKGHVYAFIPDEVLKLRATAADGIKALAAAPGYSNVSVVQAPASDFKASEPLDLVWTSQNYHDLHNKNFGVDVAAFNKAVFAALKPGGFYIVLDHVASADAPADVTETLHRINPEVVKQEVVAAGFKFEGASAVLKNAADDHSAKVFDPSIRGKTDQFVLKFRKPK